MVNGTYLVETKHTIDSFVLDLSKDDLENDICIRAFYVSKTQYLLGTIKYSDLDT